MDHPIEWLRFFVVSYPSLEYVIIFFSSLLGGEFALFALGFLVAQSVLPIFPVILVSFFGALAPNIFWFLIGSTATMTKIISHRYAHTATSTIVEAINRASGNNNFIAIIITKFIVGTPIILSMYVSKTTLKFKDFMYYESVAIFLSLSIMIPIGFISGLGFNYLAQNLQNIYAAIGLVLLVVIIIIMLQILFKNRLTKSAH